MQWSNIQSKVLEFSPEGSISCPCHFSSSSYLGYHLPLFYSFAVYFFLPLLTFTLPGQFTLLFSLSREISQIPLSPLALEQLSGFMRTLVVKGHSDVLVLLCFICVWEIQTIVRKIPNAHLMQRLVLFPVISCPHHRSACLWWDIWGCQSCLIHL